MSVGIFVPCVGCRNLHERTRIFSGVQSCTPVERPTFFSARTHLVGIVDYPSGVSEFRLLLVTQADACPYPYTNASYLALDRFVEAIAPAFFQSLLHEEGA